MMVQKTMKSMLKHLIEFFVFPSKHFEKHGDDWSMGKFLAVLTVDMLWQRYCTLYPTIKCFGCFFFFTLLKKEGKNQQKKKLCQPQKLTSKLPMESSSVNDVFCKWLPDKFNAFNWSNECNISNGISPMSATDSVDKFRRICK